MVYLLHFDRGFKHARHFVGFTDDVEHARALATGTVPHIDNPLLNAARGEGVSFSVVQTWPGGPDAALKRRIAGNHARLCRACAIERRKGW